MGLFTLSNTFGGLLNRPEPHLIGPNKAQALSNVQLYAGSIQAQMGPGTPVFTGSAGVYRSMYKFNGTWVASLNTIAWQYVEFGGKLIRATAGQTPQVSSGSVAITNATNAAPISITATAHGYATGTSVDVASVLGNTAANGTWTITVVNANTFTLNTSTGNGTYTSGGTAQAWYNLGVSAPLSALTATTSGSAGLLSGTYSYYVTFVSSLGGESSPSPASNAVTPALKQVNLTAIPTSADPQVTVRKIYRVGGTVASIALVGTLNDNSNVIFTDNVADTAVGNAIQSTTYAPPGNLEWIAVAPYGVLFGGIGSVVYYCQPALYQAWPATNSITLNETLKAGIAYSGNMIILSVAQPYKIIGDPVAGLSVQGLSSQQGCLERDTVVDMGSTSYQQPDGGIYWLSNDGICQFNGLQVSVISKLALADSVLSNPGDASPTNAKAVRYNERYILFIQAAGSTSFPAGGYIEWDRRTEGNWKQGTVTATAVHYNRIDDKLYIARGDNNALQWEDPATGTTLAGSYTTGAWIEQAYTFLKHWKQGAVDHAGAITVTVTVDGMNVVNAQALTQSTTVARSRFRLPAGSRGRSVSMSFAWAAGWTGKIVEVLDNIERKADQL